MQQLWEMPELLRGMRSRQLRKYALCLSDSAIYSRNNFTQIKKGEKVLITGIGGLGALAIQFATHLGAEVYALDIRPSSRELALHLGVRNAFNLVELDEALAKGFQVDVAVDFVATDTCKRENTISAAKS